MAGDWIKMRAELESHPKVLRIFRALEADERCGLFLYACGADALELDVLPPSRKSVQERASEIVTEQTLRDVTLLALLRVWCVVNAHCNIEGTDAICAGIDLWDLDVMARFAGFGEAMSDAGWVIRDKKRNLLRFPNFLEFNEPACLRKKPMTGAERVALCRANKRAAKRAAKSGATPVTPVTICNARGEGEENLDLDLDVYEEGGDVEKQIWEQVRGDCQRIDKALPSRSRQDQSLIVKAAYLARTHPRLSQDWLWPCVETTAKNAKKSKAAYFHGALRKRCAEAGLNFNALLAGLVIPADYFTRANQATGPPPRSSGEAKSVGDVLAEVNHGD